MSLIEKILKESNQSNMSFEELLDYVDTTLLQKNNGFVSKTISSGKDWTLRKGLQSLNIFIQKHAENRIWIVFTESNPIIGDSLTDTKRNYQTTSSREIKNKTRRKKEVVEYPIQAKKAFNTFIKKSEII